MNKCKRCGDEFASPRVNQAICFQCQEELDPKGWPGDGSGEDDLADHNQNEADDYTNE